MKPPIVDHGGVVSKELGRLVSVSLSVSASAWLLSHEPPKSFDDGAVNGWLVEAERVFWQVVAERGKAAAPAPAPSVE